MKQSKRGKRNRIEMQKGQNIHISQSLAVPFPFLMKCGASCIEKERKRADLPAPFFVVRKTAHPRTFSGTFFMKNHE